MHVTHLAKTPNLRKDPDSTRLEIHIFHAVPQVHIISMVSICLLIRSVRKCCKILISLQTQKITTHVKRERVKLHMASA